LALKVHSNGHGCRQVIKWAKEVEWREGVGMKEYHSESILWRLEVTKQSWATLHLVLGLVDRRAF